MGDLGLRWEQTGKIVAENTARIEKVETRVEKEEARGDRLEHDLKKTKDELEDLKKSLVVVKEDAMKMSVAELGERESNKNNVIMHRVAESASNEPSERQAHDLEKLVNILKELGLINYIKAEDVKFIRRIGERKENQEARPMKVGFKYFNSKERLLESARNLNQIPDLRQISITNDLTDIQRKEENNLWKTAGDQNLAPTSDMKEKGLVMKVVGPRGHRRIIMATLRSSEEVDAEGRVRLKAGSRRREGAVSREQEPTTGANRVPLGSKEQGNGQGAVVGRSRGEEHEEQLRQGGEKRKRPSDRSSQSSDSGEEQEGREKERKAGSPSKSLEDYPDVMMFPVGRTEGGEEQGPPGGQGAVSRLAVPLGLRKTTALPFRSSSASSLMLPGVAGPRSPGLQ